MQLRVTVHKRDGSSFTMNDLNAYNTQTHYINTNDIVRVEAELSEKNEKEPKFRAEVDIDTCMVRSFNAKNKSRHIRKTSLHPNKVMLYNLLYECGVVPRASYHRGWGTRFICSLDDDTAMFYIKHRRESKTNSVSMVGVEEVTLDVVRDAVLTVSGHSLTASIGKVYRHNEIGKEAVWVEIYDGDAISGCVLVYTDTMYGKSYKTIRK